ncbi:MAG: nucleotide exchange factor GrpE [Gordonia sp. (in: high G+C Gram-positive bacteria)]|jgi:molecular chaperone GrpE|nr:nucleotide exchange factor GrpE [Gordonia sp. (in: high G+C Gram-positive bacteria)]
MDRVSPDAESDAGPESATIAQVAETVQDLARVIARQAQTLDRLVESDRSRGKLAAAGADLPLLVDLFDLYTDATLCAESADNADRAAFAAIAAGLDRVISGRHGVLVVPSADATFDARTMEAVDVVDTDAAAEDRTVERVIRPGLQVGDRSIRAATVIVRRHRPS